MRIKRFCVISFSYFHVYLGLYDAQGPITGLNRTYIIGSPKFSVVSSFKLGMITTTIYRLILFLNCILPLFQNIGHFNFVLSQFFQL